MRYKLALTASAALVAWIDLVLLHRWLTDRIGPVQIRPVPAQDRVKTI